MVVPAHGSVVSNDVEFTVLQSHFFYNPSGGVLDPIGRGQQVRFFEGFAINEHGALHDAQSFPRQTDHALEQEYLLAGFADANGSDDVFLAPITMEQVELVRVPPAPIPTPLLAVQE